MKSAQSGQAFSIPSIIAIVAAVLSFTTGAFWGLILALVALICGAMGVLLSLSPNIRGGIMSTLSLIAGAIGLVAALIKGLMWLL